MSHYRNKSHGVMRTAVVGMFLVAAQSALALGPVPPTAPALGPSAPPVLDVQQSGTQELAMDVQRWLQTMGLYSGAIDGIAGPSMANGIRRFNQLVGIDVGALPADQQLRLIQIAAAIEEHHRSGAAAAAARSPSVLPAYTEFATGTTRYNEGNWAEAEASFAIAYDLYLGAFGPRHGDTVAAMRNLALVMGNRGSYAEAEALLQTLLAAQEIDLGPEHPETLRTVSNIATSLFDQGQHGEAEALRRRVVASLSEIVDERDERLLNAQTNLAVSLSSTGQFEEAEALYRQVLVIRTADSGPEHPVTLLVMGNLAEILRAQNRLAEAETLARRVLSLREETLGPTHPDTLRSTAFVGQVLANQDRHAEAEGIFAEMLPRYTEALGADHPRVIGVRSDLAQAVVYQGRYAEGEVMLREVVATATRVLGPRHPSTITLQSELASSIAAQLRLEEAADLFREVLVLREDVLGPNHRETLSSLNNLAVMLRTLGEYQEAEGLLRRSLEASRAEGFDSPASTLRIHDNLGETLWQARDIDGARETFARALEDVPAYFATASTDELVDRRAALPLDLPRYLDVLAVSDIPPQEAAAASFLVQGWLTFGTLDVALTDLGDRIDLEPGPERDALRQFQDAREALNTARTTYLAAFEQDTTPEAQATLEANLGRTEANYAEAEARLANFPRLADLQLPRPLSAAEAQALLEPGEALLAYALIQGEDSDASDFLHAWVVTRDSIEWKSSGLPAGRLAEIVTGLRASLDLSVPAASGAVSADCAVPASALPDRPFDACLSLELHDILLGQFVQSGALDGISDLIVVADGPLEQLPFSLLVPGFQTDGTPRWLIAERTISSLPTTSSLRALRREDATPRADNRAPFLGVAPVEFPETYRTGRLATLQGTETEVRSLAGIMGVGAEGLMLREVATEAALQSRVLSDYAVISFATHAWLGNETASATEGQITEPALVLRGGDGEDGLLTATEAASLRLNADWVLLSACNTAAGGADDAEGLSGLARSFFFAGARSLLVSHWYVDDATTSRLMSGLFDPALGGQGARAAAFQTAVVAIQSQPETAHPIFWAAFDLVGQGG